jgi:hypothetical protein
MNEHLIAFEKYFSLSPKKAPATSQELGQFEARTNLILPYDLKTYFLFANGWDAWDCYNTEFFCLKEFKTVQEEVGDFGGISGYKKIIKTLPEHVNCYVFANHFVHSAVYVIRLHPGSSNTNEVYILYAWDYILIANSFNEFLDKYVKDEAYP